MKKWLYKVSKNNYNLSVIIPTFNNADYLVECIQSVINSCEKCSNYEILLGIDNCYKTVNFLNLHPIFSKNCIKIFFFPKKVGPYIIRNSLANISKYDNILFFDSDDILMQDTILILMDKVFNKEIIKYKFYNFLHGKDYGDLENLSLSTMFSHGSFLIKKEKFIEMNGFFGWKCGADTEFDNRCKGIGQPIHNLDTPLFYRRYHGKNVTILPETGINSNIRKKYGDFIQDRQLNNKWTNPNHLEVFNFNIIKL
jgi:glycosyltransferase involved in cell wall biosynthesis